MDKEELIERESKGLNSLCKEYLYHVEDVLSQIRNEKVKLWLNQQDQYRLLTIKTWETKYKVDTRNILQILLPFWNSFIGKRQRKVSNISKGLGVRISTLTGKKSEQVLIESLKKQYPNRENISLYVAHHKERIIQHYLKRLEKRSDGVHSRSDPSSMYGQSGKVLTLLDFSTPEAFVKYYRKWIKKEQLSREIVEQEMRKRAYRGNPFRPEFL